MMQKREEIDPNLLKEIIDTYWIDLKTKDNEKLKKKYQKKVVDYYLKAKEEYKEIIAIEEGFSHIDDNMIVKGRVDLIARDTDDRVRLIDFKSRSSQGLEKTNIAEQLRIYDYCLSKKYKIDLLAAHTLDDNQVTYIESDSNRTEQLLIDMSKEVQIGNFQPRKNDFCTMCQFKFYCKEKGIV